MVKSTEAKKTTTRKPRAKKIETNTEETKPIPKKKAAPRKKKINVENVENEEVVKEEVTNEEVVKEEVTNEEVVKEEVTNEEVVKEEVTNEEVVKEEVANDETTNDETVFKEIVKEETVLQEVEVKKEPVSEEIISDQLDEQTQDQVEETLENQKKNEEAISDDIEKNDNNEELMNKENIGSYETTGITDNKSDEKIEVSYSEEIISESSELNRESEPELKQDQILEQPIEIKKEYESIPEKNIKKNITKISKSNNELSDQKSISYIDGLLEDSKNIINSIEENVQSTSLVKIEKETNNEDVLLKEKLDNIIQNLKENNINEFDYNDINKVFNLMKDSVILFQIKQGTIHYLEKKGMESRNQSIISLIFQTHKSNPLADNTFMIYTGDELDPQFYQYPFVLSFHKKKNDNHHLFPSFTFQHWKELNNGHYHQIYTYMTNKEYPWENRKEKLFWSGYSLNPLVNLFQKEPTMEINIKNQNQSKSYFVEELVNYKYLLCIDDNLYSNRLNYMFLTKSCVIILKNEDTYNEEYYHKYFNVNEDYFEITYNNKTTYQEIKNKINHIITKEDCKQVALNAYQKAKYIFHQDNINEYIYNLLLRLSVKCKSNESLSKNIFFTSSLNDFVYDRIIPNKNEISFYFRGNNFELEFVDKVNKIELTVKPNVTNIFYNLKNIFNYRIPNIMSSSRSIEYRIHIDKDMFQVYINKNIPLIQIKLPDPFTINQVGLKTNNSEGIWFT